MNKLTKILLNTLLFCMSQSVFAACDDPDALPDCVEVIGDENDSFGGSGSGGGGSLGMGGGGGSGGSGEGSGVGGGSGGSGDWEREFKKCEQAAKVELSLCDLRAQTAYNARMDATCDKLLGEQYTKCSNKALREQKEAEDRCIVFYNSNVSACH